MRAFRHSLSVGSGNTRILENGKGNGSHLSKDHICHIHSQHRRNVFRLSVQYTVNLPDLLTDGALDASSYQSQHNRVARAKIRKVFESCSLVSRFFHLFSLRTGRSARLRVQSYVFRLNAPHSRLVQMSSNRGSNWFKPSLKRPTTPDNSRNCGGNRHGKNFLHISPISA